VEITGFHFILGFTGLPQYIYIPQCVCVYIYINIYILYVYNITIQIYIYYKYIYIAYIKKNIYIINPTNKIGKSPTQAIWTGHVASRPKCSARDQPS
jgi:hypothetical protein